MPFTATELEVIEADATCSSEKEALAHLEENGFKMHRSTYYKTLARIDVESGKRLYEIAKGMKVRYRQRIDKLELIERLQWKLYKKESDLVKKSKILKEIREMQVYLSAFDQGAAGVIKEEIRNFGKPGEADHGQSMSNLFDERKNRSITTKAS